MTEKLYDEFIETEDIKLIDLIDVSILQQMQDAFAKMARMAALTADENGMAVTKGTNFSELCTDYCRKSPIGKARCEQCDKMGAVKSMESKKTVAYKCHANLVDFAAPIMLGNRMIGSFIGGQVLSEAPDEEEMRQVAREIQVDEDKFVDAAKKTQIIPQTAIERLSVFLYEFAQIMSDMAYQAYISRKLSQEAMQAAIQKQDFLANMSHEIRTPMNAVLGMAEMALREDMSTEARNYVSQIQASGKHLLVIINDILDFSKIDSGKMTIVDSIYETEALISDIANVVNSRIGTKDIVFKIDVPCDMPIEMYGDYVRIQQILINLLNNAVKFTDRGNITLRMEFEPIDDENVLFKADVIDTGNGIKEEDLNKLFNSFQQVDSKRNRNVEGTGLGLAIAKQLVTLMGGNVYVKSTYGKGSTFTVEFPQRIQTKGIKPRELKETLDIYLYLDNKYLIEQIKNDLTGINCNLLDLSKNDIIDFKAGSVIIMERVNEIDSILDMAKKLSDTTIIVIEAYDSPNDLKGDNIKILKKPLYSKKILALLGLTEMYQRDEISDDDIFSFVAPEAKVLIVDDNPINLTVAKGLMEPLNMKVDTAGGAQECICKIQDKKYDLIFMDHMMPGVDGIETTHVIRRMYGSYADVPIIALTANATGGAREMFIAEGMNDFVAKPIETKKIVAKIREWLPAHLLIPVNMGSRKLEDVSSSDSIVNKIDIPGLNIKEALKLLGNEKLYLDFLKEYYLSIDDKSAKIQKAYDENDIHTYTIEVHALKSSSRQIGADDLSKLAEKLEKAGNDNDMGIIDNETFKLLWDYKNLKEKLSVLFANHSSEDTISSLDAEAIDSYAQTILQALEDFDFVTLDETWSQISQYKIEDPSELEIIKKIKAGAEEFDVHTCKELLEQWRQKY